MRFPEKYFSAKTWHEKPWLPWIIIIHFLFSLIAYLLLLRWIIPHLTQQVINIVKII